MPTTLLSGLLSGLLAGVLLTGLVACGRLPRLGSSTAAGAAAPTDSELAAASPPASGAGNDIVLAGGPLESAAPPASADPASASFEVAPAPPGAEGPAADAGVAPDPRPGAQDPLEPVNRRLFAVDGAINQVRDRLPVRPVSGPAPRALRQGLANVMANLQEPTTFANQLLQRRIGLAARTVARFAINSSVGLFGLFNAAHKAGLERVKTNFGQTLQAYGVAPGPYLYVPVVGPMTLRDVAGMVADGYLSPFAWLRLTDVERRAVQAAGMTTWPGTKPARLAAHQATPVEASRDEYAAVRRLHYPDAQSSPAPSRPAAQAIQVATGEASPPPADR